MSTVERRVHVGVISLLLLCVFAPTQADDKRIQSVKQLIEQMGGESKNDPRALAYLHGARDSWIERNPDKAECAADVSAEALLAWADLFSATENDDEMSIPQFMDRVIIQLCEHALYVE